MLQIIQIAQINIEIFSQIKIEVFHIQIGTVICETCPDCYIIFDEIAHVRAYFESVSHAFHVFQHQEIQIALVMLRIRNRTAKHPLSFRDEHGVLYLPVYTLWPSRLH